MQGPLTNIAAALKMEPAIRNRVRVVCMAGSVRYGYDLVFWIQVSQYWLTQSKTLVAEYNVRKDIKATQDVFGTHWAQPLIVTPLDTCGIVRFEGLG